MHIVYIGAFRLPDFDAAAARVLGVAKSLRGAGHEVSFISWGGEYRKTDYCPDGKYRVDGFEYIITDELDAKGGLCKKIASKILRGNKTKAILRQYDNIDVIISYNWCLTNWLLYFTKKKCIKLISDITEWYSYSELKITDWIPYAYNMFISQRRVKNKFVISSYLDKFYKTTHNMVIPATYDLSNAKWNAMNNGYVANSVEKFDGITLIYAGNPSRKDLLHTAINAVQRLLDEDVKIRFFILGITREKYLDKYKKLVRISHLNKNIKFVGRVPQDTIPAFYSVADFMVLVREPTRKSNAGFPTKLAESIASGTPVIANITSDIGLYIHDGVTGFIVDRPSEEDLYNTLKKRVLPCGQDGIYKMKCSVKELSSKLDYHAFISPIALFMAGLK